MAKEKSAQGSVLQELLQTGLYKRNQGRITRQVTFASLAIIICLGAARLASLAGQDELAWRYVIPGVIVVVGLWISYRIVNLPAFADFLIGVEGEMAKVSWPTRAALIKSSLVVIITIFFLAAILYAYDFIWRWLLQLINVIS